MSVRNSPTSTAPYRAPSSDNGRGPLRVRLSAPPVSGVVRIVFILATTGLGLYLVWRLRGVIQLLAISLFFAFALFPVVDAVAQRTRARRSLVILAVYLVLMLLVLVIAYVVIPSLVKELQSLSRNAPHYAHQLRQNATIRRFDNRYHISAKLVRDARNLPEELAKLAGPLKDVTVGAAAFITQLLAVLSITFLLVLHGRQYAELGLTLTGERQERYRKVLIDIKDSVAQYTLGNIVISVTATVATWIVLTILGVPYALALGLIVGFFDFIPLIGATLGAIVVAVATLPVDFPTATIVWIVFIIVWQRIEDYIIQPHVYGRTMNMNPIVTIVSLLVGAELLGILGVLLAIPAAAAIQIILRDWWAARANVSGSSLDEAEPGEHDSGDAAADEDYADEAEPDPQPSG
ncbi:MAG TPA: AI-2E family transporter [Solirubrobacteraceae bacterium]|nr:AI-2E family transporter [Solirubrobacteraceae bacterium]